MRVLAAPFAVVCALAARALACGCFTPPDPTVPIVQAGERILFTSHDGQVTAHIQIQYAGDAKDFGWLLPLPTLPTLELGTDELFTALSQRTLPSYRLQYDFSQQCRGGGFAFGASDMAAAPADGGTGGPAVVVDSIGPYDYAVLKADDKQAMLGWLAQHHYFVPVGTEDTVGPYLHPGAYFLALKLRSGQSTGDLQPVVVRYASDLPMIPIVLTSTGATPHMGIAVWMLGEARAIPRNYYHVLLNDAAIDWEGGADNYYDVLTRAVAEAPGKHAFVTEYAGSSSVMQGALDWPGRFGDLASLRGTADVDVYLDYLRYHGYYFGGPLLGILQRYFPLPPLAVQQGITPGTFYANFDYFHRGGWALQFPNAFDGLDYSYDPVALTDEIEMRVVQPSRATAALFDTFPYLTRLYTTLSPEDMTRDPAFSQNPFLPDVGREHLGRLSRLCAGDRNVDIVATEAGFTLGHYAGTALKLPTMPASLRVEILREAGAPELVQDNRAAIEAALAGAFSAIPGANGGSGQLAGGCSLEPVGVGAGGWLFAGGLLVALVVWRRRRG